MYVLLCCLRRGSVRGRDRADVQQYGDICAFTLLNDGPLIVSLASCMCVCVCVCVFVCVCATFIPLALCVQAVRRG